MLARSGPLCEGAVLFTPALVLAVLHRLPKASPPVLDVGFGVGLPKDAMEVEGVYEEVAPPLSGVEAVDENVGCELVDAGTEVK